MVGVFAPARDRYNVRVADIHRQILQGIDGRVRNSASFRSIATSS
jgi:hypothetical protein